MPGQRSRKCCSSRMTPMQHTRIHARCQSARRLSCRLSPKPTAPVDVQMPLSLRPQKTHPGLLERPRSLLSIIWDTEVRTSPPRVGTGGAKRLGNRRQARRQGARGPGTAGHRVTRTTRPIRPADGGFGYGPDGGYPGQGQQGYPPQDGQYGNAYGQQRDTSSSLTSSTAATDPGRVKRARAATAARRDTRSPTTTSTNTARTRTPDTARQATTSSPHPDTRRAAVIRTRAVTASLPATRHRQRAAGTPHRAVVAVATRRCRQAARAATRRKTRATTGTAGSPPPRTAQASRTPARTGSTARSSTSTARARARQCAIRLAAIRTDQGSKGPARYPVP